MSAVSAVRILFEFRNRSYCKVRRPLLIISGHLYLCQHPVIAKQLLSPFSGHRNQTIDINYHIKYISSSSEGI